eukprot:CAMPEP_0179908788 /NCGR_PEP_ID=MMETSP0982-20121206/44825_1 /TAXON_ID=483367 /ORGANISM="non described non described, Strain CCMP 2436" /LENGTH=40 /DNA_ID= /DNA_START= /DNA_END= /DNA_ORIENTATION=
MVHVSASHEQEARALDVPLRARSRQSSAALQIGVVRVGTR